MRISVWSSDVCSSDLIDWIGGADEQAGFVYFGVILGALTIVSVLVSGLITRERVGGTALDPDSASLLNAARYALRNRALLAILVAKLLFFIGYAFIYVGASYIFKYLYLAPVGTKLGEQGKASGREKDI